VTASSRCLANDYKQYKIVVGVGPVGEAFDPPLEWHSRGVSPLPAEGCFAADLGA
jgi:hypothetical protein